MSCYLHPPLKISSFVLRLPDAWLREKIAGSNKTGMGGWWTNGFRFPIIDHVPQNATVGTPATRHLCEVEAQSFLPSLRSMHLIVPCARLKPESNLGCMTAAAAAADISIWSCLSFLSLPCVAYSARHYLCCQAWPLSFALSTTNVALTFSGHVSFTLSTFPGRGKRAWARIATNIEFPVAGKCHSRSISLGDLRAQSRDRHWLTVLSAIVLFAVYVPLKNQPSEALPKPTRSVNVRHATISLQITYVCLYSGDLIGIGDWMGTLGARQQQDEMEV